MITLRCFYPKMYVKNIFDIDYEELKRKKIHCLIFDLDNTIALIDQKKMDGKTKKLFDRLKKDFQIVIISNNSRNRVEEYALSKRRGGITPVENTDFNPFVFGDEIQQRKIGRAHV